MIVQSGNDATIALAERVAGTEETFAQLMNSNAKRLGMVGTHFQNSSGLPSPDHYTTARDMSLLAIAMIRDFPSSISTTRCVNSSTTASSSKIATVSSALIPASTA